MSGPKYSKAELEEMRRKKLEEERRRREEEERQRREAEARRKRKEAEVRTSLQKLWQRIGEINEKYLATNSLEKIKQDFDKVQNTVKNPKMENLVNAENQLSKLLQEVIRLKKESEEEKQRQDFESSLKDFANIRAIDEIKISLKNLEKQIRYNLPACPEKKALLEKIQKIKENLIDDIPPDVQNIFDEIKRETNYLAKNPKISESQKDTSLQIMKIRQLLKEVNSEIAERINLLIEADIEQIEQIELLTNMDTEYYFNIVFDIYENIKNKIEIEQNNYKLEQEKRKSIEEAMLKVISKLEVILNSNLVNIGDIKTQAYNFHQQSQNLYNEKDVKNMEANFKDLSENADKLFKQFQIASQQELERDYMVNAIQGVLSGMGYEVLDAPYQEHSTYKAPVFMRFLTPAGDAMQIAISADGTTFTQLKRLLAENQEEILSESEIERLWKAQEGFCDDYTEFIQRLGKEGVNIHEDCRKPFQDPKNLPVIRIPVEVFEKRKEKSKRKVNKNTDVLRKRHV